MTKAFFSPPKMPRYTIAGLDVEFPLEIYDVQRVYVEHVVRALNEVGLGYFFGWRVRGRDPSSKVAAFSPTCCALSCCFHVFLLVACMCRGRMRCWSLPQAQARPCAC
jgi:hypothetical protein